MQYHRELEIARDFELVMKILSLHFGIEALDKEVEPAFADRDRTFACYPLAQSIEVLRTVLGEIHRVQAVGWIQAGLRTAQIAQFLEAGISDCRNDLPRYARVARAREHGRAIAIKLRDIDMRMAVDQVHKCSSGSANPQRITATATARGRETSPC